MRNKIEGFILLMLFGLFVYCVIWIIKDAIDNRPKIEGTSKEVIDMGEKKGGINEI